ncbi:MAG: NmrA family NAD(P)-binding protein [Balneolaceae bacterium]
MKTIQTIAVIGATGMLGRHVTHVLKREGFAVTAVVRDMQKAQRKLHPEISLHKADLQSVGSLQTAFRDVDFVYLSLSTGPGEKKSGFKTEIDGVKNVIEAAKRTKVKRIGFLSSLVKDYDNDWWVFDIKRRAVQLLLEADIPVTIFYPSNFYENITELQMSGRRIFLAGTQHTKSWWVGTQDYGKQVAAAFLQTHEENREYPVQGPEPYNFEEAADIFNQHYKYKKLKKLKAPLWILKLFSVLSSKVDFQYRIVHAINNYDEEFKAQKTWQELGKPRQTLKNFAEQF